MDEPTISLSEGWNGDAPLRKWGPFDLVERVGHGGFGEVYRAFDPTLQRVIAVKLLFARSDQRDDQITTILREARAMARVIHPNVVPIYGVQTHEGRVGFWTAFVQGKTLSALLAANGPFGPREVVHIGVDLCRALGAVHAAGLLHRDVKCGNAMREEGGRIVLMDFGLTHEREGASPYGGTPGYIAPELQAGAKASVRTDIYALGVLLFHLLTGKYPSDDADATWNLLEQRPDLPAGLVRAVHTAIEKDPGKRFAGTAQMAAALDSESGLSPTISPTISPVVARSPWPRYAAGALVVVIGLVAYQFRSHWQPGAGDSAAAAQQGRYNKAHDLVLHYEAKGALEEAVKELQPLTREAPTFAPAFADLGRANYLLFLRDNDPKYVDPARKASLDSIALNSHQSSAHVTLGMLYTQQGNSDLAIQELDTAERANKLDPELFGARAQLYQKVGRNDEIEATLQKAINLAPGDWRWPKLLADYYARVKRYDEAILQDQNALRLSPDNARVLNNLGLYLMSAGRLPEAKANLQSAIRLDPTPNRYTNLATVEYDLGNDAEAIQACEEAIRLNPKSYRAWFQLAGLYQFDGHTDPAKWKDAYRKSISLAEGLLATDPKNPSLLNNIGVMFAQIGDFEKALPLVRQAVALESENGENLFYMGFVYELMHRRSEALTWIGSALRHRYPLKSVERAPELASLRTDKKYLAIVASLR